MIINSIELQNITTHQNTSIQFTEGINILAGPNGTGKSTVLKMLGYVLFDTLPGNQKESIRYTKDSNPRFGVIKVLITGIDNEQYLIERSIGKPANTLIVKNATTGVSIRRLEDHDRYFDWIRSQLRLPPETNLGDIFENAIGVDQGTFTAPFSFPAAKRKPIFDPIINIEIYEIIWKRLLEVVKQFEIEYTDVSMQIKRIEGELAIFNEISQEKVDAEQKMTETQKLHETAQKKLEKISIEYGEAIDIKQRIDQTLTELKQLDRELAALDENIRNADTDHIKAEQAREICERNYTEFTQYTELMHKEQILRQKSQQFQQYQDEFNSLSLKLNRIEGNLDETQKQAKRIEDQHEKLETLKQAYEQASTIKQQINDISQLVVELRIKTEDRKLNQTKLTELYHQKTELERKLQPVSIYEAQIAEISSLQQSLQEYKANLAVLDNEMHQLSENEKLSQDGMCPLLHEKCQNLGAESLEQYFKKQIKKSSQKIRDLKKLIAEKQKECDSKLELQRKLEEIKSHQGELIGINQQIQSVSVLLSHLDQRTSEISGVKQQEQMLTQQSDALKSKEEGYLALNQQFQEELPSLLEKIKKNRYDQSQIKAKLDPIAVKLADLNKVPLELKKIQDLLGSLRGAYEEYQSHVKIMENLPIIKTRLKDQQTKKQNKIQYQTELIQSLNKLHSQFDDQHYKQLEIQKNQLILESGNYSGQISQYKIRIEDLNSKIQSLKDKQQDCNRLLEDAQNIANIKAFVELLRIWFKEAGPKIATVLLATINKTASEIYRQLIGDEAVQLTWVEDYEIVLTTAMNEKRFKQLSGGEQMAAALAVRLALLKVLTAVDFAFFDEPTTNLDYEKRKNLAQSIQKLKGFQQLFIISHDDTFEISGDHVIHFSKQEDETTSVSQN